MKSLTTLGSVLRGDIVDKVINCLSSILICWYLISRFQSAQFELEFDELRIQHRAFNGILFAVSYDDLILENKFDVRVCISANNK